MLFNNIMKSGQVPADWKEANVVTVFKGGCKNVATNYRPVSLMSQLSKVFETIARDQVVEFLEVNKLIIVKETLQFKTLCKDDSGYITQLKQQKSKK